MTRSESLPPTNPSASSDSNDFQDSAKDQRLTHPLEVQSYIQRRAECNHWGGEDAYDAERSAQIETAMNGLKCSEIDDDKATLLQKYANDSRTTLAISAADTALF